MEGTATVGRQKTIARDYLSALLCDNACLQKSAAFKLASSVPVDDECLSVLLSLVRGELPSIMPAFSSSDSLFCDETWIKSIHLLEATDTVIGKNTLRECLKNEKAWERGRLMSLDAVVSLIPNVVSFNEVLQHLLVGIKQDHEKKLTNNEHTNIECACTFVSILPNADNFEYMVLQIINANPKVTWAVMQRIIHRSMNDVGFLPKCKNLLARTLYNEPHTPVFGILDTSSRSVILAKFGILHFCQMNRACLNQCADYAVHVIDKHIHTNSKLKLLFLVVLFVRIQEITDVCMRQKLLTILKSKLNKDPDNNYYNEISSAVLTYPNVMRIIIDAIVAFAFKQCIAGKCVIDSLIIMKLLLDFEILQISNNNHEKVSHLCLDVASLLKMKVFVLYLEHSCLGPSQDNAKEFLISLADTLTEDFIETYVGMFDIGCDFKIDLDDIWGELDELITKDDLNLSVALKQLLQSASDVVWSVNNVQRMYLQRILCKRGYVITCKPMVLDNYMLNDQNCIHDDIKICLGLLCFESNLHALSIRYIMERSLVNNEESLFFVPILIESSIGLGNRFTKTGSGTMIQMLRLNVNTLVMIARHRLALPVCYNALQYIFKNVSFTGCKQLEDEYKCMLLKSSELPSGKVQLPIVKGPSLDINERQRVINVFKAICEFRPQDGIKRLNDLVPAFGEFPDLGIVCVTKLAANQVLDFGIAFNMYIDDLCVNVSTNSQVGDAVASFFIEYIHMVTDRVSQAFVEDDIIDLNIILSNLHRLCALNIDKAYFGVGIIFKSKLWPLIKQLEQYHVNKECNCYSLLDKLKRQEFKCMYSQLPQRFFTMDLKTLTTIAAASSSGKAGNGLALAIAGLLDCETDSAPRGQGVFNRGSTREILTETHKLISTLNASGPNYQWLIKLHNGIPNIEEVESGLHPLYYWVLFELYRMRHTNCSESQIHSLVDIATAMHSPQLGSIVNAVCIICNSSFDELPTFAAFMIQHLENMVEQLRLQSPQINIERIISFCLGLTHLRIYQGMAETTSTLLVSLLEAALLHGDEYMELCGPLFMVLGRVYYKYAPPLQTHAIEDVLPIFECYLDLNPSNILGWAIGLLNLMTDMPYSHYGSLKKFILKLVAFVNESREFSFSKAILLIPIVCFAYIQPVPEVSAALDLFLSSSCTQQVDTCIDANTILLMTLCNHWGFTLQDSSFGNGPLVPLLLHRLEHCVKGEVGAQILAVCIVHNTSPFFNLGKPLNTASIGEDPKSFHDDLIAACRGNGTRDIWNDENAAMVALWHLYDFKTKQEVLMQSKNIMSSDVSATLIKALQANPHSQILQTALTFAKPLKAPLEFLDFENAMDQNELELLMRVYVVHGFTNEQLLQKLSSIAKMYSMFTPRVKASFMECLLLASWRIDYDSLRIILSYITDVEDAGFLNVLIKLLEIAIYAQNDNQLIKIDMNNFANVLVPIVCGALGKSGHYFQLVTLYKRAAVLWNGTPYQTQLQAALAQSSTGCKCIFNRLVGSSIVSIVECFAKVAKKGVKLSDVALFVILNRHRHLEIVSHAIQLVNVHENSSGVVLAMLLTMAIVSHRNLQGYIMEFVREAIYCANPSSCNDCGDTDNITWLIKIKTCPNVYDLETCDPAVVAKSANETACAPGMWEHCGLQTTWLGQLLPMQKGRNLVSWLTTSGNSHLDTLRRNLKVSNVPRPMLQPCLLEHSVRDIVMRNEVVILSAYKSYLIENGSLSSRQNATILNYIHQRIKR
ncbi:hypothetical protein BdWA1_003153 [Babesia duncani]|uniref:Uncharacterized protein n=1 Tax=Babesia duncani TaxID=323732 RepID=A0AAD9UN78_9APIC|nr:hypothetical protein BdWA1_003153 [Babesia duncani]